MRTSKLTWLACLLLAGASCASAAGIEQAMRTYEEGNFVLAETQLRAVARNGDARAAEILGFMHAVGPALYPGVQRDLRSAIHWFDIAARGGRPAGRYMVCALQRQAGAAHPRAQGCFDWVAETGAPRPR